MSSPPPRQRCAIVPGSGGMRSIAALGMVHVPTRQGLRPDLVVGRCADAMFGALIAVGHGVEEAVPIATTLWSVGVTRKRRWRAIAPMLWTRLGRFDADFARRDDRLVMRLLEKAFGDVRIEGLHLAPRVTTTDATTGERVVLRRSRLVQAMHTSIALPRRLDRPTRMRVQVTSALSNNLKQAPLAETGADGTRLLSLVPRLERRVGLFDTAALPYLVDADRRATEAALPTIHALLHRAPLLAVA